MTRCTQIKTLLNVFLKELNDEILREFQWKMGRSDRRRPIHLEDATRQETVDELVQVYGEDGAVAETLDIFIWMKLYDLVVKLTEAQDGIGVEQSHEAAPAAASASEDHREADSAFSDLSCAICFSIFTDPVTLQCGHSFCRNCVNRCHKCPLCRKVISDTALQSNLALKSLSENYRRGNLFQPSGGHRHESHQPPPESVTEERDAFEQGQNRETAATVHHFRPNYTAQRESNVVAPSFIASTINNVNINIISNGEASVVLPEETFNHDTVHFYDSSSEQIMNQSFNTAQSTEHYRNPFADLEEEDLEVQGIESAVQQIAAGSAKIPKTKIFTASSRCHVVRR